MTSREEIEQQLTEWAANNSRRDSLVHAALIAGVTPNRIHTLTGIARTTIYRIKESVMISQKFKIGERVERPDEERHGKVIDVSANYGTVSYLVMWDEGFETNEATENLKSEPTIYTLTTDEGTETIEIARNGDEVREVYTVDGDVCDDSIVCDNDADEYLRRRDIDLRADGYVTA